VTGEIQTFNRRNERAGFLLFKLENVLTTNQQFCHLQPISLCNLTLSGFLLSLSKAMNVGIFSSIMLSEVKAVIKVSEYIKLLGSGGTQHVPSSKREALLPALDISGMNNGGTQHVPPSKKEALLPAVDISRRNNGGTQHVPPSKREALPPAVDISGLNNRGTQHIPPSKRKALFPAVYISEMNINSQQAQ